MMDNTGITPVVLQELSQIARRNDIELVILFGSRARGDFKRTSDIDIAVRGGNTARFMLDIEEETSTLLQYDVVDLDTEVENNLLESIRNEGITIYEKV